AHSLSNSGNGQGIHLFSKGTYGFHYPATTGIIVEQNIVCDWPTYNKKPIFDEGHNNTVVNNIVTTGNCSNLGFPNPDRSVGSYFTSIGGPPGATTDDFLKAAISHWNRDNWDAKYLASSVNAYIRSGFGMTEP